MFRIVIALPSAVKETALKFDNRIEWCYVGKDVRIRTKVAEVLGEKKRFYLRDKLQSVAEELRQPFLDFVAYLGKHQKDEVNWWSSRFASRSPFQTDFFLLLCYKSLVEKIVQDFEANKNSICIFIEDPWLFLDLKESYENKAAIEFIGRPRLLTKKLYFLIRGIVYRVLFACWLFVAWVLMFYLHGGRQPAAVKKDRNNVAILSYAEKKAFANGRYFDPYTGELADLLEDNGISTLWLVYLKFPLHLSREIGRLGSSFWPLIFDLQSTDIFFSLIQWWSPYIPEGKKDVLTVNGYSARVLLKREWWEELGTHGFNYNLMLYKAMLRFLAKGWCRSLVYLYENQPWEKLLCIAAKKTNNVKLIGYQHSSMPRFLLSQFLGKGEENIIPLPDKILTMGRYLMERYKEGGIPTDKLSVGGAWRYENLLRKINTPKDKNNKGISEDSSKHTILIALPVDTRYARALLSFITYGLVGEIQKNSVELLVKSHPNTPLSAIGIADSCLKGLKVVDDSIGELLRKANVVLYSGTGVGLEALLYGDKKVIRYVPENLIDMDRIDWLPQDFFITLYDGDNLGLSLYDEKIVKPCKEDLTKLCYRYFSEIDQRVWLEALGANPSKRAK